MRNIRFVLVRPQHPGNIGAAARVMANFGLEHLVLVAPEHDPLEDPRTPAGVYRGAAWAMACDGAYVLEKARVVGTLEEAVGDAVTVLATTRRLGDDRTETVDPVAGAATLLASTVDAPGALLFGPEATGLTNEDMVFASGLVTIPSRERCPSLNLAQAVAVMAYALGRAAGAALPAPTERSLATARELSGFHRHLKAVLARIGFLNPQNPDDIMRTLRRLFARARPDRREVRILRGICRQTEWALDHPDRCRFEPEPGHPTQSKGD